MYGRYSIYANATPIPLKILLLPAKRTSNKVCTLSTVRGFVGKLFRNGIRLEECVSGYARLISMAGMIEGRENAKASQDRETEELGHFCTFESG